MVTPYFISKIYHRFPMLVVKDFFNYKVLGLSKIVNTLRTMVNKLTFTDNTLVLIKQKIVKCQHYDFNIAYRHLRF